MPIDRYFKGHGSEVMSNMVKEYGAKKGKSVFYATSNKNKATPSDEPMNRAKKILVKDSK